MLEVGWPCAWCETILVKRKGGWKRPDLQGRITEPAAHAIHSKYESGVSARTLGRELYRVLGYKTASTCEAAIGSAFKRYGLPRRERIAATVLASTTSGLSPRNDRGRRRRRREAGLTAKGHERQPICKALKAQAPRKGSPCTRPAMEGSDYCLSHDPARGEQRERQATAMRARLPRRETVAWSEIHAQLAPWLARHEYPKARLAEATGVPHATCARLLEGQRATITIALARKLLVVVESTLQAAA